MKRILLLLTLLSIQTINAFGQVPESFQYQSVIRDVTNAIVNNQIIGIQVSIQQGNIGGLTVYSESFTESTNSRGIVSLPIGSGTVLSGDFSLINWANGPFYLGVSCDLNGGTNYLLMNTTQLMSVPYAIHSKSAQTVINDAVIDADADPLNELQALSRSGSTVNLSNGGGNYEDSVTVYTAGTGITIDNNEISAIEPTYTIGYWPELGGNVFWVSPDGKHGLVAENDILTVTSDDGYHTNLSFDMTWAIATNAMSNPLNHTSIGRNFTDWRLPTLYELNEIYLQQYAELSYYSFFWSSTEVDENFVWVHDLSTGIPYDIGEKVLMNSIYVVSVRSF